MAYSSVDVTYLAAQRPIVDEGDHTVSATRLCQRALWAQFDQEKIGARLIQCRLGAYTQRMETPALSVITATTPVIQFGCSAVLSGVPPAT